MIPHQRKMIITNFSMIDLTVRMNRNVIGKFSVKVGEG